MLRVGEEQPDVGVGQDEAMALLGMPGMELHPGRPRLGDGQRGRGNQRPVRQQQADVRRQGQRALDDRVRDAIRERVQLVVVEGHLVVANRQASAVPPDLVGEAIEKGPLEIERRLVVDAEGLHPRCTNRVTPGRQLRRGP